MNSPTHLEIASNINLWNEYVNPDGQMSEDQFDALAINERLAIIRECFGEQVAVGFNETGETEFVDFLVLMTRSEFPVTRRVVQSYFDSMEFANWDTGENCTIEISGDVTISGNPATFPVTRDMVEFMEAANG